MTCDDLETLLESWLLHLRARRRSPNTVSSYAVGVRAFIRWCRTVDREATLDRDTTDTFIVALFDGGAEGATAAAYQRSVRLFSAWLAEEGEIPENLLDRLKPVVLEDKPLKPLTAEEMVALIAACKGARFTDRRDEALVRFMHETMARAGDTLSMTVAGTHVHQGVAELIGKGRKPRSVPFGPATATALDRYIRARRTHRLSQADTFWLGASGRGFGYDGLYWALKKRAEAAGIEEFHPHRLRRTGATNWLRAGGSETGLMAVAGWENPAMLRRYTKFTSNARAIEESRGLNLGDL